MQKKFTDAEDAFRQSLQIAPGLSDARLQLADLLLCSGNLEKAATECSTAIQDSPELPELYLKRAEIRTKQKQYNEGLSDCNLARTLAPYTHPAKVLLAVFCFQNGELEMARTYLLEALAEAPEHPAPPLFLGQLALRDHDSSATRKYPSLAESRPIPDNWPESHNKRFRILLHSTRFQLAQQLQDSGLARDSISKWLNAEPENVRLRQLYEELRADPNAK